MHRLPLLFAHFFGPENNDSWKKVFEECTRMPGFDVVGKTTKVDQQKNIEKAYNKVFENAKMFLDPIHVKKNMGAKVVAARAIALSSYERALNTTSCAAVDKISQQYNKV